LRDEAGGGGGALHVEGKLVLQRGSERGLCRFTRQGRDDRAVADLRGRDGFLQAGFGAVRAGYRGVRREEERLQDRRDLHQVLPGRVPLTESRMGGTRIEEGDRRTFGGGIGRSSVGRGGVDGGCGGI